MSIEQGGQAEERRIYSDEEWFRITHGQSTSPDGEEPVRVLPPTPEELEAAHVEGQTQVVLSWEDLF